MPTYKSYSAVIAAMSVSMLTAAAALGAPAVQAAGAGTASVKWTKISADTGLGLASAGLLRTSDGRLHVVWPSKDGTTYSLHYSTVGGKAKLINTGSIVTKWPGVSVYPRLVPGPGGGIRLVFTGGNGKAGSPYNLGAMYSATSGKAGNSWSLTPGSLSHSTLVPLTDTAAITQTDGTPVATWAAGSAVDYHVGISPQTPDPNPDPSVAVGSGAVAVGPALARSGSAIMLAWYASSGLANQGYYVTQIRPSLTAKVKAPNSGGANLADNQPRGPVAFAARAGGGDYLAYCVPTKTVPCGHIALWKTGSSSARSVPASSTGHAAHVAIAAGPGGHLWIMWYDTVLNKIKVVRTNAAATGFGTVRALNVPSGVVQFDGLQAEASTGPADVVALVQQTGSTASPAYFDTQVLPALRLAGSRATVSHTQSTTITFTVTDTGSPVAGATVTFLGKKATTNSAGKAKITVPKGTSTGKHTATASKAGYVPSSFSVKVT